MPILEDMSTAARLSLAVRVCRKVHRPWGRRAGTSETMTQTGRRRRMEVVYTSWYTSLVGWYDTQGYLVECAIVEGLEDARIVLQLYSEGCWLRVGKDRKAFEVPDFGGTGFHVRSQARRKLAHHCGVCKTNGYDCSSQAPLQATLRSQILCGKYLQSYCCGDYGCCTKTKCFVRCFCIFPVLCASSGPLIILVLDPSDDQYPRQ